MGIDVYKIVTDRIIDMLENGVIPWHRPWTGAGRWAIKHTTGEPYSLLNQLLLDKPGEYLSYKQCQQEGGKVKKGSKAKVVVFWTLLDRPRFNDQGNAVLDTEGEPVFDRIPYLKYSNVFHIDDCEGIEPKTYSDERFEFDPIEQAETVIVDYVARSGIGFTNEDQGRAYYSPRDDRVVLPLRERFASAPVYYSTAFHELTHSTGHPTRLNRIAIGATLFGDNSYSKEELVAELGSATILHLLGIENDDTMQNNAAYIQGWLKALKNDKRMIVSAANKADKAVQLITKGAT